jgi:cell division protein FtsI/penicillin-binding protein 2
MFRPSSSFKTNRVLQIILGAFLLIAFRVWHLEVVQRPDKMAQSERPKRRSLVLKADRGTLSDRFHIPLAINKICYKASIYYNQISQLPAISWKEDPATGARIRITPRRDYIRQLSEKIGSELKLDPTRIEDQIHAKASLFPHVPFVIKSFLTENEYFRIAALEKDWFGIQADISSERFYPKGRTACDILGTMGSISSKEYLAIANELDSLQKMVDDWEMGRATQWPAGFTSFDAAVRRLQELKEKAYTLQDLVGKSGIEGQFEQQLRGFYGKKIFEIDPKGKCLFELSGSRDPIPGQHISLTISAELQEFAEALLAQDESFREGRSIGVEGDSKIRKPLKQPWIKGGSIIALDPNTGEVLAMASTPRFDPNDFIPSANPTLFAEKQRRVSRWLENESTIGAVWDGRQPLIRERYTQKKGFFDENAPLTWELFLQLILPNEGPLKSFFTRVDDVKTAVQVQEDLETLLFYSKLREPSALLEALYPHSKWVDELKSIHLDAALALKRLDSHLLPLVSNGDRLLAIDLCRLVVHAPALTDSCLKAVGSMKLGQYRACNQAVCTLETSLKERSAAEFQKNQFRIWREEHQKDFLAEMRKKEKENHLAPRPYLDYLDQKEKELFALRWKEERLDQLAEALPELLRPLSSKWPLEEIKALLHSFRSFKELERPLLGSYRLLRKKKGEQTERELAASFYPIGGFGHSRSFSFQAGTPQGSIFKLVTSYAALIQTRGANPLTLVDTANPNSQIVATHPTGAPYPRSYKGGRLPRSHTPDVGKIDLVGALEQSSNPYFSILTVDVLSDPEDLIHAARLFGFGSPTGIDLPGEASGKLPVDLKRNQTGLYSTAIGQHTLLTTPLQTAAMIAAIANGGKILKPILAKEMTGPTPNRHPWVSFDHPSALAREELACLGLGFPLFTAAISREAPSTVHKQESQLVRTLELPSSTRNLLLEGMDRTVWSSKGTARPGIIRGLKQNPALLPDFLALRHQMIGKTSTAEVLFNPSINPSSRASLYKHIWFGAIGFDPTSTHFEKPDIVVVVYLRYGDGGKEAAPLAAQMITKWREIKHKMNK